MLFSAFFFFFFLSSPRTDHRNPALSPPSAGEGAGLSRAVLAERKAAAVEPGWRTGGAGSQPCAQVTKSIPTHLGYTRRKVIRI